MVFDPIKDEDKPMSLQEWAKEAKDAIDEYVSTFDSGNEFHKKPHPWKEWMNSFIRWSSW